MSADNSTEIWHSNDRSAHPPWVNPFTGRFTKQKEPKKRTSSAKPKSLGVNLSFTPI
jgi:hypothetical protein